MQNFSGAAMLTDGEPTFFLKDYAPQPYAIDKVELDIAIAPETARVRALLKFSPRPGTEPGTPLVLDGDGLKLNSVAIDGSPLPLTAYEATASSLTISEPPN